MNDFPLSLFRCPQSGVPLREATADELSAFNQAMAGCPPVTLGDGTVLVYPWRGAWRGEGEAAYWYPVVDGIPVLVPDAGQSAGV